MALIDGSPSRPIEARTRRAPAAPRAHSLS